jgi:putative addiction module component (TIGR02574 family)
MVRWLSPEPTARPYASRDDEESESVSKSLEQLEIEALALPISERAHLAHRLIESLDEDAGEDPVEVERAWKEEIERRMEEYRTGKTQPLPAAEVFARARARLR